MNNYRVYITWADNDSSVVWVDANSAEHACFIAGQSAGRAGIPAKAIINVTAVLETN
jgi:hypothetical protein